MYYLIPPKEQRTFKEIRGVFLRLGDRGIEGVCVEGEKKEQNILKANFSPTVASLGRRASQLLVSFGTGRVLCNHLFTANLMLSI